MKTYVTLIIDSKEEPGLDATNAAEVLADLLEERFNRESSYVSEITAKSTDGDAAHFVLRDGEYQSA